MKIEQNVLKKSVNEFLKKHLAVLAVYLYGSWVEKRALKWSDLDLGILLKSNLSKKEMWKLEDELPLYIEDSWPGEIDVRALNLIPLSAQFQIISRGELLACRDLEVMANYESHVRRRYWDFQKIEKAYHCSFLERQKEALSEVELREYQRTLRKIRDVHQRIKEKAKSKTRRL